MSPSFRSLSFKRRKAPKLNPGYNPNIEKLRIKEYPQLKEQTYLDHSGTTLYAESLLTSISADLRENLYGNPHSQNPSSKLSAAKVTAVRLQVLSLFKADPAKYDVVFCANTTAGVKLVADAFAGHEREDNDKKEEEKKRKKFKYRYHKDCHTSLIGPRGLADSAECFSGDEEVEAWLDSPEEEEQEGEEEEGDEETLGLFAWPGQSNFSGRRLPIQAWSSKLREKRGRKYYSLFDAAALVMTSPLDLSDADASPDFIVCSFYKMFGYPDLGALIVRRESSEVLQHRKYFGGGTVGQLMASMDHIKRWYAKDPHEHLEDGTCAFHSIIALGHAMDTHKRLYDSFERISAHTAALAAAMASMLGDLTHRSTGRKLAEIYTEGKFGDPKQQGPVITFNLRDSRGEPISYLAVEEAAGARNIHIRSGGHCNPGGVQHYCRIPQAEMKAMFDDGKMCGDERDVINGRHIGALRASLGAMSTLEDVLTFVDFVREEYVSKPLSLEEKRRLLLQERKKDVEEVKRVMKKYGTVLSSSRTGKTLLCFWTDSVNLDEALPINNRLATTTVSVS
ncbi:PLP-dependent transferase [Choiromyces venosus 120613-1]|uniref:PLP-dependent transferase n=1 Tax=Choiromyces venosus 120613-1 TaxID=1336337 RepID=A0A3N4JGD5_9PEZI|nr:PLP-dependent transferase [Choiromyces venosus 120613-1]